MDRSFAQNGYKLYEGFFDKKEIEKILFDAKSIFYKQIKNNKICSNQSILDNEDDFTKALYELFKTDLEGFINCGKQIQHLISLHRLSLKENLIQTLKDIGLSFPNISTRPVMFFNSPSLAKEKVYHTVFSHQDWYSMQGSLDSIVVWLPLINMTKEIGALEILPQSHKRGLVVNEVINSFGKVDISDDDEKSFKSIQVKVGDALFFSSFLIHRSGINTSGKIRWSAHFRYNNLDEATFVERKYPHAYIYRPQDELITEYFPDKTNIDNIFKLT